MSQAHHTVQSNVVIITGVFFADIENYRKIAPLMLDYTVYTVLPAKFTDVESWPRTSNLRCWNCDMLPDGIPRFIPINPEFIGGRLIYTVLGTLMNGRVL